MELDVFVESGAKRKQRLQYFSLRASQRGVLITLVADVAQSYFILREFDLELEIARRTFSLTTRLCDLPDAAHGWCL